MKIATLFILTASYVSHSLAQVPSVSETEIMTIQPVTPIIPSSSLVSRTSSRIGGSQVQPSSFSTSRLTISDVSTDRPTPTTASTSTTIPSTTITSIASGSTIASGSNAASSPTATSNAALERFSAPPLGFFGTIVAVGGIVMF